MLQAGYFGFVAIVFGLRIVERLLCEYAFGNKLAGTIQRNFGVGHVCFRLVHVGARLLDFFRTRTVLELGQLGLQVCELALLLRNLGTVFVIFETHQRLHRP